MAHNVSNEYKQVIYSQQAKNKLKLLFNNVELQDADRYCEKLTVKSRIIPNGAKIFSLNNFISKEADLILHDIDTSIIQNQVSISIGTLVGNSYEYVPIGIFNIQDTPTNDKRKTTIKLRDNSVKFDFNYNAQPLIEQNGGVATKLQILQDICSQAGVTCNITSFIGYLDEIGVYDNTITAREYISRTAEQAGKIATINRSGELIFVDLNNLTTWEIPIEVVEKYENGTKFKIGRVVYEDGIIRYETPTSNDDTLFLDGSNNYINGELVKEQASSNNNTYYLQDSAETELIDFELEGKTTQETRSGKNLIDYSMINTPTLQSNGYYYINFPNNKQILNGIFKENTQYTLSFDSYRTAVSSGSAGVFYFMYDDGTNTRINIDTTEPKHTSVTSSSGKTISYIRITWASTNDSYIKDLQLEEGTIATEYEEYGAMPSPDYPSELVSVGYENLFDKEKQTYSNGARKSVIDTGIRATQTIAGTYKYCYMVLGGNELLGKTISTSCRIVSSSNNIGAYVLFFGNSSTVAVSRIGSIISTDGLNTMTIPNAYPTNTDRIYLLFYSNLNGTGNVDDYTEFNDFIITIGSQVHSYIPYGKYGVEVKTTGKNLFYGLSYTRTTNGITFIYNDDGSISVNGTANANAYSITTSTTSTNGWFQSLKAGTYTLSGGLNNNIVLQILDSDGTALASSGRTSNSFTITSEKQIYIRVYVANGTQVNTTIYPQLEEGTLATTYEEYKSSTYLYTLDNPLRSRGDTKDLLYIKNGMLYVDRKIGSVVLDGNDGISKEYSSTYGVFWLTINNLTQTRVREVQTISNYFKGNVSSFSASEWANYPNNCIAIRNGTNYIGIKTNIANTVPNFNNWLSTHNTEVQYVLAEPYTEELGQVDMPSTYKGITYIDILSNINTNSYIQYRQNKTQLEAILQNTNQFSIDSLKTGKILGNPAIDSYDLIQITDGNKIFKTLATNDLVYTGVLINTFDTQIGEEAKEQNVFINGEETFKKWARTTIDNVEGTLTLQAGQIDEANGKINETNLIIEKDGALLNVLANNSNIDVQYDSEGNPLSGEVREVTTTTGFKFNAEGMTIEDTSSNFKAQHRNTGTYYKDGDTIVGQYTKDGSKQKDLDLFGVYTYGKNDIDDTPMFIAQLFTDGNGEECFGHFYNRGD